MKTVRRLVPALFTGALVVASPAAEAQSPYCSTPNLAIPDADAAGVTDSLVVADSFLLTDLDLSVQIDHGWVGDVIVTLEKTAGPGAPIGPITLIDRPGAFQSPFGCGAGDIDTVLSDGEPSVEDVCIIPPSPPPAIDAGPYGPSPGSLNANFAGIDVEGTWQLRVSDDEATVTGTFVDWCLITTPASAPAAADRSITNTDGVTSAVPGETLSYTIVAANAGPDDDPAVTVTDTFPGALTCSWTSTAADGATGNTNGSGDLSEILSLPAGSSVTYTATCDIDPAATGPLSNTATIAGSVADPVSANDSATDDDTVLAPTAELAVTKTDGRASALPGDPVTYTIVATNAGPSDAPAATVTDTLPAALDSPSWTCAASAGSFCPMSGNGDLAAPVHLAAGGTATFTVTGTLGAFAGELVNTATVTAGNGVADSNPNDDSATDTTSVGSPALLTGTKEVSGEPVEQGVITYLITLVNGAAQAQLDNPGDELVDVLPAGLTLLSATADAGVADVDMASNTATWNGEVAGGGSVVVTVEARIDGGTAGQAIANQATISFDADGDGTNESSAPTDDPATAAAADPTVVLVAQELVEIPTLGSLGLIVLAGLLAMGALLVLRRS